MAQIPDNRAETAFSDYKPAFTPAQAVAEANRCIYCSDAPCIDACPTTIDIPEFIRKISTDNLKGSARTIFKSNILGMSCARVCPVEVLCAGACVFENMGAPPIAIGRLQRYVTDLAFEKEWRFFEAGPDSGKSVGLVGGGPSSIATAHELRQAGHACTLYEKRDVPGGLNTTGIAPYKLRSDRAIEEIEWVFRIGGIDLKTGVAVGEDVAFAELESRHDAIFLGFGLGPDSRLFSAGEDLEGVEGAVEFIERLKLRPIELSNIKRAVVIGGGNTAIDAVRELVGLGVGDVSMMYRGSEGVMKGYAHEWEAAKIVGAQAMWRKLPTGLERDGSRVSGVRCVPVDENKKPIEAPEEVIPADLVLLAIGQSKLTTLVGELTGIELEKGRVKVDVQRRTGRAGYFAGGDCINGGKEVVNAVADGKAAGKAIDAYLNAGHSLRGGKNA